jgi:hypothetical protein
MPARLCRQELATCVFVHFVLRARTGFDKFLPCFPQPGGVWRIANQIMHRLSTHILQRRLLRCAKRGKQLA